MSAVEDSATGGVVRHGALPWQVVIRLLHGIAGTALSVAGVALVANAWQIRGGINELQETVAVVLGLLLAVPGLILVREAMR